MKLVAVGAVAQRKRPFAAIDTIEWLHERGLAAQLTWVGDGPLRLACQKRLGEKGLEHSVRFVGAVQPDQVPMYLQAADLFLLPSSHETFFASAAEAIGAGRGVVICRLPGLGDFLTEENSILVEDASAETLGTAVLEASSRFRNVEAKHMASSIRQNYSIEAVSAQFSSVYRAALARA
ncbi:glycosyltransferase [Arthrobacter sp. EH-1B-1]|uniref:D-inositol 3-phosphate glycosyltransferase n=1 Tax=Arthrobacter vasquezii TaxID=2977629 RepID=A0ABT6CUV4_9MICC|nr:glycosyltransferase [Arthrobacter vasquezii]